MNDRIVVYLLAGAFLSVLIWRSIPAQAGGAAAPDQEGSGATQGQPTVVPTLDAEFIVGMSYGPEDGSAGPAWYCAQFPGDRPGMPPIPSAVQ